MTARSILFNGAMVRAILAGAKTQTRRLVKPPPPEGADPRWTWCVSSTNRDDVGAFHHGVLAPDGNSFTDRGRERQTAYRCPFGAPGDDLWVRETWAYYGGDEYLYQQDRTLVAYRATFADDVRAPLSQRIACDAPGVRWRPSIHMPRWASRIDLRVRQVRVERLHDITEDDAKAEGIRGWTKDGQLYKYAPADDEGDGPCWAWVDCPRSARDAFTRLWREINGRDSWDANPLVWRVEFWRSVDGGAS